MSRTITSGAVTFMDTTDNRRLDVYITSNLPNIQIKNSNTNTYTPDWASTPLVLKADAYLDSHDVNSKTKFSWYKQGLDGNEVEIGADTKTIIIDKNDLDSGQLIVYICKALYKSSDADDGIEDIEKITFSQTTTGKNGADGTGVNIKGTATSVIQIPNTDYYTITYAGSDVSQAQINDSYMYNGDLYVCVDSRDGLDYFINVGRIQGPKGEDAQSIILTGGAQVFKVSKTNTYTPAAISVSAIPINTTVTEWTYSVNGGQTFLSTAPTGVVRSGNIVAITGATLASNSLVIKASDGQNSDVFTIYKAFDGNDGSAGQSASMAFLTNENISLSANQNGQVALTSFTTNVVAYSGTTKVTPTLGTITGLPSGMTVATPSVTNNEQILTFSVSNNSTLGSESSNSGTITIPVTSPVSTNLILSWSKINTGATGVGISSTTVTYGVSDSATTQPTAWQPSIPAVADGKYLWTRTVIDYTDPAKADTVTYTYAKQGADGEKGNTGSSFKIFTTAYETTQTNIENWSKLESSEWTVNESTSEVKVGDTIMLSCYNTTKQGYSYILGTVISIPGDKVIHTKSIGLLDKGDPGAPASLVDITPSALYFKSTTGANGTFTPQYIYLYPRFQNATYQGWQYSRDGGVSWQDVVSGLNWLLIDTFDSVPHSLRIDRGSTLYTDTITSISFRCNSTIQGVYDTISIAKIYDVVDLQIGGRNLVRWTQGLPITSTHNGPDGVSVYSGNIADILTPTDVGLKLTFNSTTGACMSIPLAADGCVENGELYTLSFDYRGNITQPGLLYFLQRTSPNVNINLSSISSLVANETEWQHYEVTFSSSSLNARINYQILLFYGLSSYTADNWIEIKKESLKLEKGNKKTAWTPAIEDNVGTPGAAGADAVTFQVYSSNGYALSANTPTVTLQTFAYIGDIAIQAGATYQWYQYSNSSWVAISGATNAYLTVSRDDVALSNNYMCTMQFNNVEYVGVVTIDDKSDVNKVFTAKPSNYVIGDLWIVGVDYVPAGVEVGTLLKAEHTSNAYVDADWVAATKYDDKINELQSNIDTYNQYFSFDSGTGLKISAKDANGTPSQFSTSLTNERLSFNYGNESIAYINGTKMNIKEAEIESPLTVTGKYSGSTMLQAPIINIGNFSIVVESNGSLSIITNT